MQGDFLPKSDPMLLSETSVKSTAEKMITKYGSQAWGMADVKARALAAQEFHSFAATWERVRDVIGVVQSRTGEMN
jgi:hypothetical protein